MNAQIIDLILLAIIALSAVAGFAEGVVRALVSIALWGVHLFVLIEFTPSVAHIIGQWFPAWQELNFWLAVIGLSVMMFLVGMAVRLVLSLLMLITGKTMIGRVLGAGVGTVRGVAVVLVVILLVSTRSWAAYPAWQNSAMVRLLAPYAQEVSKTWHANIDFPDADTASTSSADDWPDINKVALLSDSVGN